ncbi:hypothetical protein GSI_06131 [Ganoderma sinense ZZ0214-1]|uniref:Uncharacterized protein n=1 Tax=Ganoderma sinense ZZ0214-1 TaxID=1077348 RepID=A0A2G8SCE2_9APHY|nr:hypothetical protein GSI_06131 [Ganoderma sinense ZZ0214-1]
MLPPGMEGLSSKRRSRTHGYATSCVWLSRTLNRRLLSLPALASSALYNCPSPSSPAICPRRFTARIQHLPPFPYTQPFSCSTTTMAQFFRVFASSQSVSEAGSILAYHEHPTLADAVAIPPPLFHDLHCFFLSPHDFASPNTELHRLLKDQVLLHNLDLRMMLLDTQDGVHTLDITGWRMVALQSLHVYGFFPRGLGQWPSGMGNEFSNLTSLTLGRVDGLGPQTTVSDFFAAARTWNNLKSLTVEHYSQLMVDPNDLSQHFALLPLLETLSLSDEPAWIAKFLTYTSTPLLSSLHLHTSVTIPNANPAAVAAMLTSWLPQGPEVQDARVFSLLHDVRNVTVHMGEDESKLTRIVGAPAAGGPIVTLEVASQKPFGMKDDTWRSQYTAWARSAYALEAVLWVLPRLFPSTAVSVLDVSGDFDSVLADPWHALLQHYSELSDIKIHARGSHGVEELFPALLERDIEDRDVVCPNLSNIIVEDARYSRTFLPRVAQALEGRRYAMLAFIRLKLVCSHQEYARDFSEGGPMVVSRLDCAEGRTVGSFNLEILDPESQRNTCFFAYGTRS